MSLPMPFSPIPTPEHPHFTLSLPFHRMAMAATLRLPASIASPRKPGKLSIPPPLPFDALQHPPRAAGRQQAGHL
eukprot:CAMPEP_0117666378 /NCGR_PEP_ID=MMETSP0804-20121206/10344_1 /TAXON_ID=1074897 /ORGANISM="Tetraselmis astigmatica, Strain CCMP880" /LENGTH=74 /DNA_ID=CAMNT_0005473919 /DNA_START=294 /DNA_END=515 /DNA_ORIENTATION=-